MTSREQPGPNIGTRIIAEHDRVKLWELKLDPGEASEWHAHENDYIFIVVEGGKLFAEYEDGGVNTTDTKPGEVVYNSPSTHRVTNTGTTRYRNIIVELLD